MMISIDSIGARCAVRRFQGYYLEHKDFVGLDQWGMVGTCSYGEPEGEGYGITDAVYRKGNRVTPQPLDSSFRLLKMMNLDFTFPENASFEIRNVESRLLVGFLGDIYVL